MGEGGTGGVFKVSLEPGGTAEGVKDFIWTSLVSDTPECYYLLFSVEVIGHLSPPLF